MPLQSIIPKSFNRQRPPESLPVPVLSPARTTPATSSFCLYGVVRLKGVSNYYSWSGKAMAVLMKDRQWPLVGGSRIQRPDPPVLPPIKTPHPGELSVRQQIMSEWEEKAHEWDSLDEEARGTLILLLEDDIADTVVGFPTAAAMWTDLRRRYGTSGYSARFMAIKDLMNEKLEGHDSVESFYEALLQHQQNLRDLGHQVEPWVLTGLFLLGLEPTYESFVQNVLRTTSPGQEPNIDDIYRSIRFWTF